MEQDEGFGLRIWRVAQVEDVSVWAEAANDGAAGRGVQALALEAYGDFAVIADADAGLQAPDEGPPGAGGQRPQDRAVLGQGLLACRVRRGAQFAVDFVLIDMRQQLVEQVVGAAQFEDVIGRQ